MKNLGCWVNPKTGEVRVVVGLKHGMFAVVKLFRDDEEYFSIKFWSGSYDKTMSYWNTKTPVSGKKADIYYALAKHQILLLSRNLKEYWTPGASS